MSQPQTPSAMDLHKKAFHVIAVADAALTKAATELRTVAEERKTAALKGEESFELLKKAELLDMNNPAQVKDIQNKLGSHAGTHEVLAMAIDQINLLYAENSKLASGGGSPPPERPVGGKAAALGTGAEIPTETKKANDSADYAKRTENNKRAADESYLQRLGVKKSAKTN